MKVLTAIVAMAFASPVLAQVPAAVPAAKFSLETPIEQIVADPAAKAVLDTDLPGLTTNDKYEMFKGMSLTQVAGFAPDKLTPERLAKTASDLAPLK